MRKNALDRDAAMQEVLIDSVSSRLCSPDALAWFTALKGHWQSMRPLYPCGTTARLVETHTALTRCSGRRSASWRRRQPSQRRVCGGLGDKRIMGKGAKPNRPRRGAPVSTRQTLGHRGGGRRAAGIHPPGTTGRELAGAEARPRHDAWLHGTSATPTTVEVCCNETPRHSWQAKLTLGPADRIIIDGRSAAQAIERLLTVLPAALAARHLSEEGPIMPSIKALHPSGFEILLQVPSLEEIDATITDLLRRGYRPAGPSSPGWGRAAPGLEAPEEAIARPQEAQTRQEARTSISTLAAHVMTSVTRAQHAADGTPTTSA